MSSDIQVVKRDGVKDNLDLDKLHKVVEYACEGVTGVSASQVEISSHISFFNNIKTTEIQETIIKAAADLISEETPNYQFVAGRLIAYSLRKEVFNQFEPIHVLEHVKNVVSAGLYDKALLSWYTEKEWNKINKMIVHSRDENLTYAAMEQFRGKYLVKDRSTGKIYETPQLAMILIAATLFHKYPNGRRMTIIKEFYDALSNFDISMPTPIMAGVRSNVKQFSSCVLIESDDSLDSINATSASIVKYVSKRAGIGIGAGRIRAIGSKIGAGHATHTGVIPFYKLFQAAVTS